MQNIVVRFKLAIPSLSRNMSARQFRGPAFLRYFLSKYKSESNDRKLTFAQPIFAG